MSIATSKSAASTEIGQPETEFLSGMRWQEAHGGIIGAAVQNLRARSIKNKSGHQATKSASSKSSTLAMLNTDHIYDEPAMDKTRTNLTVTNIKLEDMKEKPLLRSSIATSTPALVVRIDENDVEEKEQPQGQPLPILEISDNKRQLNLPLKPPRKKSSRSNSPNSTYVTDMESEMINRMKTAVAKAEAEATVENVSNCRLPSRNILKCLLEFFFPYYCLYITFYWALKRGYDIYIFYTYVHADRKKFDTNVIKICFNSKKLKYKFDKNKLHRKINFFY